MTEISVSASSPQRLREFAQAGLGRRVGSEAGKRDRAEGRADKLTMAPAVAREATAAVRA